MADDTTPGIYWCPAILLTFVTQMVGIATPFWYQASWVQHEMIRKQHAGLFSMFNDVDFLVICGGSDVCEDFYRTCRTSWIHSIGKIILMVGTLNLLLGSVMSAPGCSKTNGTDFGVLARICGCAACLNLSGCVWIYVTFYCDTMKYQVYRSFVSLQIGYSFYLTLLTGCLSSVLSFILFSKTSNKDARTVHAQHV